MKRKRSISPPPPPVPSRVIPSPVPHPPRDPYPLCLICLDEDDLHPEYGLDCGHYCHLACLQLYLNTSISFCPDVDCRVPITLVNGDAVEPRYSRVDDDYASTLSSQLIDSLVQSDVRQISAFDSLFYFFF